MCHSTEQNIPNTTKPKPKEDLGSPNFLHSLHVSKAQVYLFMCVL